MVGGEAGMGRRENGTESSKRSKISKCINNETFGNASDFLVFSSTFNKG